jgi:hypothetical protein
MRRFNCYDFQNANISEIFFAVEVSEHLLDYAQPSPLSRSMFDTFFNTLLQ